MSNNYYFKDKKVVEFEKRVAKIVTEIRSIENELEDSDILFPTEFNPVNVENLIGDSGTLHIGQYVNGASALLKYNPKHYTTVGEMKEFYEENKDRLVIIDEGEKVLDWEELEKQLLSAKGPLRGQFQDSEGYCWTREDFC